MILNPIKTKTFVVSRSRTVCPHHSDLILSGVSIRASPNLDIICGKFVSKLTFEDQRPKCKKRTEKLQNGHQSTGVHYPQFYRDSKLWF